MAKFKKNDKLLLHAYFAIDVMAVLILCLGILLGTLYIITGVELDSIQTLIFGIIIIFPISPIVMFVNWVLNKVFINMCCDIKLIRNSLYNQGNENLVVLTGGDNADATKTDNIDEKQQVNTTDAGSGILDSAERLRQLKSLLDDGILTQDEFEAEKQKILGK